MHFKRIIFIALSTIMFSSSPMDPYKIYYQCNIDGCPFSSPNQGHTKRHRYSHVKQRPYECCACKVKLLANNVKRHLDLKHKNQNVELLEVALSNETNTILNTPFKQIFFYEAAAILHRCTICDTLFNSEKSKRDHCNKFHGACDGHTTQEERPLAHPDLNELLVKLTPYPEFDSRANIFNIDLDNTNDNNRVRAIHKERISSYLCNIDRCPHEGPSISDVQKHRFDEHTDQRPFLCSICREPLFNDAKGQVHVTKKHEKAAGFLPSALTAETLAILNAAIFSKKRFGNMKWHTEKIHHLKKKSVKRKPDSVPHTDDIITDQNEHDYLLEKYAEISLPSNYNSILAAIESNPANSIVDEEIVLQP